MIKLKINTLYRTYLNQYVIIKSSSLYMHTDHRHEPMFMFFGINMNKDHWNSEVKYFESGLSYFHLEEDIIEEVPNHLIKLLRLT